MYMYNAFLSVHSLPLSAECLRTSKKCSRDFLGIHEVHDVYNIFIEPTTGSLKKKQSEHHQTRIHVRIMLWKWLYFTLIATTSVSTCARWTFLEQSGLQVRCNAIRSEYGWQCALARRRNLWICIWLILDPMSSWEGKGYDVYVFIYI